MTEEQAIERIADAIHTSLAPELLIARPYNRRVAEVVCSEITAIVQEEHISEKNWEQGYLAKQSERDGQLRAFSELLDSIDARLKRRLASEPNISEEFRQELRAMRTEIDHVKNFQARDRNMTIDDQEI